MLLALFLWKYAILADQIEGNKSGLIVFVLDCVCSCIGVEPKVASLHFPATYSKPATHRLLIFSRQPSILPAEMTSLIVGFYRLLLINVTL